MSLPDEILLEIMHLREAEGLTDREIGRRLGITKNMVIGSRKRIQRETDLSDPTGHLNGTMPERWWERRE